MDQDDQREDLDPPKDQARILDRIFTLASRLASQTSDDAFAPGIELMIRVASNLRLELPPYVPSAISTDIEAARRAASRGDVRARHAAALEAIIPTGLEFHAHSALEEAAHIERDREVPVDEADERRDLLAVACVRQYLAARLPRHVSDGAILAAVDVYRRPRAELGRPKKTDVRATENDRAEALKSLLDFFSQAPEIARKIRKSAEAADARTERLTGATRRKQTQEKG